MQAKRFSLRRLTLPAIASLALLSSLPAHAVGRLADINVQDRETGETLQLIRHGGDYWVAGRPGARYAVTLRNRTRGRVLGVVSVDGVNVISGETASFEQSGYVLSAWQRYAITGWRKSDSEVAAFHFTASPASYAERTGRPDHVGVIGLAVFQERVQPPAPPMPYIHKPRRMPESGDAPTQDRLGESRARPSAQEAPADFAKSRNESASGAMEMESASAARRMAPATPAPKLGTGHGEREGSWVGHTEFERRSSQPDELIRIRYDSLANLVAMGIVPAPITPPRVNPFPGVPQPGYAPDPS